MPSPASSGLLLRGAFALAVLSAIGCTAILGLRESREADPDVDASSEAGEADDASGDDGVVPTGPCDLEKPWERVERIGPYRKGRVFAGHLSPDEREITVAGVDEDAGPGALKLFHSYRDSIDADFDGAVFAGLPTTPSTQEVDPWVSDDGGAIAFARAPLEGGPLRLFQAEMSQGGFSSGTQISVATSVTGERNPYFLPRTGELFFESGTTAKIYVASAGDGGTLKSSFTGVRAVANIASLGADSNPVLSEDGLTLYLASQRPADGGLGPMRIYVATRKTTSADFNEPTNVSELNGDGTQDVPTWVSRDGCRLYLASNRTTGAAVMYVAHKPSKAK